MSYQVVLMPPAEADIKEAYHWIEERSQEAAIKWYDDLLDAVTTLEMFPDRCPISPEGRATNRDIRQLIHGKRQHAYRILFEVEGVLVRVLHVRHGAREHLN